MSVFLHQSSVDNKETLFINCVVDLVEHNGYDDSDFYAVVWDVEKQTFRKYQYGSTRYWSYDCNAEVDASDDLQQKYRIWRINEHRKNRFICMRETVKSMLAEGITKQFTFLLLRARLSDNTMEICEVLLKTKKFRSDFRKSCRDQLVTWLLQVDSERKYQAPFSRKQMEYLVIRKR